MRGVLWGGVLHMLFLSSCCYGVVGRGMVKQDHMRQLE